MVNLPKHTMIIVAVTGAEHEKADVPPLPTTIEDLVATAKECQAAGASLIHVHIRDEQHQPSLDLGKLKETTAALREETDLIVQLSTGGSVHDPLERRLAVLDAEPDSCSLTCGTLNFGEDVFQNPWSLMSALYTKAQEKEVVPEFEIFDLGHLWSLQRLIDQFGLPYGGKVHLDFITGVPGGMPATTQALVAGVQALPQETTSWAASGIGRGHLTVLPAAVSLGGNLRVGMEDNIMFRKGEMVTGNAQLVARAAEICELLQRPAASVDQARELLGIKERRPGR